MSSTENPVVGPACIFTGKNGRDGVVWRVNRNVGVCFVHVHHYVELRLEVARPGFFVLQRRGQLQRERVVARNCRFRDATFQDEDHVENQRVGLFPSRAVLVPLSADVDRARVPDEDLVVNLQVEPPSAHGG